ncbi:MAG: hypothetical protein ACTSRK_07670 [Promethearchaeota archaeon]
MRKNLKKSILGLGISISLLALVLGYSIGDGMNSAFNISSHPRDAAPDPTIAIDGEVELSQCCLKLDHFCSPELPSPKGHIYNGKWLFLHIEERDCYIIFK